jgi:large subunit ribosomal protein L16
MIQSPRNIKYRKYQKNYIDKQDTPAKRSTQLSFGTYGLQCNENTILSLQQLETCRRTLRRVLARRAPLWIRAFPYKPLYKKEQGQRIGKGKGERHAWVCPVKKGQIILEVGDQVDISVVRNVFSTLSFQLGVKTKLVKKAPSYYHN